MLGSGVEHSPASICMFGYIPSEVSGNRCKNMVMVDEERTENRIVF